MMDFGKVPILSYLPVRLHALLRRTLLVENKAQVYYTSIQQVQRSSENTVSIRSFSIPMLACWLSIIPSSFCSGAGHIELISANSAGVPGNRNSSVTAISSDGRYVVFSSVANNLVDGDTDNRADYFLKDRQTGAIEIVSSDSNDSWDLSCYYDGRTDMSDDGRYVAVKCDGYRKVNGTVDNSKTYRNTFVKDRQTGTLAYVGHVYQGEPVKMSSDGRYVAFNSCLPYPTSSGSGTQNACGVYVKDLQTGDLQLMSARADGVPGDYPSWYADISADGTLVSFMSSATNLSSNYNYSTSVHIKNRVTGAIENISYDSGYIWYFDSAYYPSISADGRYVAFCASARKFINGKTGGDRYGGVFVKDRLTGEYELVSINELGIRADNIIYSSISEDGRYVAFAFSTPLSAWDTNRSRTDYYLKDRQTGALELISTDAAGEAVGAFLESPLISADGGLLAFTSKTALVHEDTPDFFDAFVRHNRLPHTANPFTSPLLTAGIPSLGWYNSDVTVALYPTDYSGTGIRRTVYYRDGETSALYTEPVSFSSEGVHTFTFRSEDNAGHTEEERRLPVRIDKTPPAIRFTVPSDGAYYYTGSTVAADYSCNDSLSGFGFNGCTGTVPSGSNIDTASPGVKSFTATATDQAGNAVTRTVTYTVVDRGSDHAQYVSSSVPPVMVVGKKYLFQVTMRNVGTSHWLPSTYRLGNPPGFETLRAGNSVAGTTVAPGGTYTFGFYVTAPQTPGAYYPRWRMKHAKEGWFGDLTPTFKVWVTPNDAAFVSQSVPTTMAAGGRYIVSVTMNNTGSTTWTPEGSYMLGVQNPQNSPVWSVKRAAMPAGTRVAPGQSHTFTFRVFAPATPGTYNFQWKMLQDDVEWFGALTANREVTVQ
jgi:hypothetical protein